LPNLHKKILDKDVAVSTGYLINYVQLKQNTPHLMVCFLFAFFTSTDKQEQRIQDNECNRRKD
jgi:hypothetical protein